MNALSQRLAVFFSCTGHATMHVLTALFLTIVLGLEQDWGMSYDELITLWTLGALMVGLGAPLAGWLGDRWSDAKMMAVFFVLTGAGAVAAGLSDGPNGLMLALAVLGLGASIYHPVGMSWLVKNATNRGRAMGFLGIFGSLGIAVAALIAGGLTQAIDWRAAFWIPGAVSIALGVALAACIASGIVVDRERDVKPEAPPSRGDAWRAFIVLSVTMLCAGLIFQATSTAMPKWFGERMGGVVGDGTLGVGGLVTMVYLFGSISQLTGGWLCDRFPLKRVYVACLLVQVPLLVVAAALTGLPLLAVATAMVFAGSLQIPAENLLLARYTPDRHRGLAFGAKFVLSFGASPLAVQMVAAFYGIGGFGWLFVTLGVLALLAFAAALLLPREAPAGRVIPPVAAPAAMAGGD
jgi:MFS transporter, FSR family, fosmidomycin resistance protein